MRTWEVVVRGGESEEGEPKYFQHRSSVVEYGVYK